MSKRNVRWWAARQYSGDVQPFPRWLRWSLGIGVLAGLWVGCTMMVGNTLI